MSFEGRSEGDVRLSPTHRNRVEVLVIGRNGPRWAPYFSVLLDKLVGSCPECHHTDRLSEFRSA